MPPVVVDDVQPAQSGAREHEPPPVRRPRGLDVVRVADRQPPRLRPVRVHDVDARPARAVARERDPRRVGGPGRLALEDVSLDRESVQRSEAEPVRRPARRGHHEDRVAPAVPADERDRPRAVRERRARVRDALVASRRGGALCGGSRPDRPRAAPEREDRDRSRRAEPPRQRTASRSGMGIHRSVAWIGVDEPRAGKSATPGARLRSGCKSFSHSAGSERGPAATASPGLSFERLFCSRRR